MGNIYLLVYYFFTTGLFSIGGGLATLPFLYDIGQKTGWYTAMDVANMVAIAQSTPGPTGINMATYVGFKQFGILGAFIGPISIVAPSLIIIIIVSKILNKFKESKLVKDVFYGIRPASTGLILAAAFSVIQISLINMKSDSGFVGYFRWPALGLAALVFALYKWKKPHPIVLIILSGLLGVIFKI
ncbi:chromate transporter [Peptostreptococcus anaerobius]|uniref:chromate transporter n=1 Tax=Peptostreptococcus anaerobius TaxID=1261 RepID=UPI001D066229|nr:chromate transporter [Peptostreptococcus anaerobius]MCB6982241.1 chromate transporter [Peptostreptococcus anaerobius]MCQ5150268.1 chromate transporter [Peptostreptococcus anaerobius]MDU1597988.1 chromate transporter [Peptostreptococcus anaerobius]MDU1681563.1 chromate transporter [Peptostreptococcus anaerobius]